MTPKFNLLAGLFLLTLGVACSSPVVRGQAPIVRISELTQNSESLSLQLNIRNLNGEPLDIQTIKFRLSVDDDILADYEGSASTNISANGTEVRNIQAQETSSGRQLLDQLQNGDVNSLPYSLEGSVSTSGDGTLRFSYEGHIYPVPGRPGHFR